MGHREPGEGRLALEDLGGGSQPGLRLGGGGAAILGLKACRARVCSLGIRGRRL